MNKLKEFKETNIIEIKHYTEMTVIIRIFLIICFLLLITPFLTTVKSIEMIPPKLYSHCEKQGNYIKTLISL